MNRGASWDTIRSSSVLAASFALVTSFAMVRLLHAQVCTRGETKVVCRGEQIQPPKSAYEKAFYGNGAYAGKTSAGWNKRPNVVVCIFNIKCMATVEKEKLLDIQWMVFV